jgi:hypothetical protein
VGGRGAGGGGRPGGGVGKAGLQLTRQNKP